MGFRSLLRPMPAILIASSGALAQAKIGLSADAIMQKSFQASKVRDSKSETSMRLISADGKERLRKTVNLTRLIDGTTDNMRLIAFNSPSDVKGTKTLLIEHSDGDDDIWIYLPAMRKTRRLLASNKKDSFVGTDFSYGDVVGHKAEDWTHRLIKEDTCGPSTCYVIESTPKTERVAEVSGYSKQTAWIDKSNFAGVRSLIDSLDGKPLKEITARQVRLVDKKNGKWIPMVVEAKNLRTGRKTIIEFKDFRANTGLPAKIFTAGYLEKQ